MESDTCSLNQQIKLMGIKVDVYGLADNTFQKHTLITYYCLFKTHIINGKIASEMPVPHSLGKYFSTPWDIEVVKQYKVQDTFRAVSVILRSK